MFWLASVIHEILQCDGRQRKNNHLESPGSSSKEYIIWINRKTSCLNKGEPWNPLTKVALWLLNGELLSLSCSHTHTHTLTHTQPGFKEISGYRSKNSICCLVNFKFIFVYLFWCVCMCMHVHVRAYLKICMVIIQFCMYVHPQTCVPHTYVYSDMPWHMNDVWWQLTFLGSGWITHFSGLEFRLPDLCFLVFSTIAWLDNFIEAPITFS